MLKNNSLLSIVYGVLFMLIIFVFFLSLSGPKDSGVVFDYPEEEIRFGGVGVPFGDNSYDNKRRFDKEFIITSNNLYQFYLYAKRYPIYIPTIEKKLLEAGIHEDFKYLPIAESALKNDVVSSAGAAGIWQFMPDTARRYGLVVDELVDERYDVEKSTDAAIEYISDLYEIFGDWALVAAAYNRGENGLRRDMNSQGVDNYYDLYLNQETSRYVFRIMAIKYVMQSYFSDKKIIDKVIGGVYKKPNVIKIRTGKIDDITIWAQNKGYTYKDIKILNGWILGNSLPEGEWDISVLQK